jgi:Flp pilus assembly protein TadG
MLHKLVCAATRAYLARQRAFTVTILPRRRSMRDQRGVAVVEFALVLPLLLLLLFGIVEFGMILYDKAVITSASRAAARQGVAFGENAAGNPVYLPVTGTPGIQSIATGNLSTNLINFSTTATPTVTVTSCTASGTCTVGAGKVDGTSINPLATSVSNALTLTSSTTMSCE